MFQITRPTLCQRAPAAAALSETRLPLGCGTAAGLRVVPAIPNGRSPSTGLAYRAAAQFRAATSDIPSMKTEGILS